MAINSADRIAPPPSTELNNPGRILKQYDQSIALVSLHPEKVTRESSVATVNDYLQAYKDLAESGIPLQTDPEGKRILTVQAAKCQRWLTGPDKDKQQFCDLIVQGLEQNIVNDNQKGDTEAKKRADFEMAQILGWSELRKHLD